MPDSDQVIRPAKDVANRCLVLYVLLAVAYQEPRDEVISWLKKESLWDSVSPDEKSFLLNTSPSEQEIINASWRAEALKVLLWALGKIENLGTPDQIWDLNNIHDIFEGCWDSASEFIQNARLRSENEIFNKEVEVYDSHWLVRDAELHGKTPPEGINPEIIQEWHYALNWLTYDDDWDEVTTDT